jgi:hypothetical protein
MAGYPGELPQTVLDPQLDGESSVNADDVNLAYLEINKIASAIGVLPTVRATAMSSGTPNVASTTFTDVKTRIENVENVAFTAGLNNLKTSGNQEIQVANNAHVSLSIRAKTDQTADLFAAKNSGNTANTRINAAGFIVNIDGGDA